MATSAAGILSLDLAGDAYKADPWPTLDAIRMAGPIARLELPIVGKVWTITTHAGVLAMVKDADSFVREGRRIGRPGAAGQRWWMPKALRLIGDNLLVKDDPDHRRLRKLVDHAFARRDVLGLRGRVEQVADALLDGLDGRDEVELCAEYANRLPITVICELLGLPEGDRVEFCRWTRMAVAINGTLGMLRAMGGVNRMSAYLRGQIEDCRRRPRPGLISELIRAREDDDSLSEDELLAMVLMLLVAGFETTANLIGACVMTLEQNPGQKAWLLADPAARMERAVEELGRYISPVQMTGVHFVARDMDFLGARLRKGETITGLIAAANTDPEVFEDADRLMLDRFPNPHLVFSAGIHFCLGMQLARVETQAALSRLYARFPDLGLAAPDHIEWTRRFGFRGPAALPVRLNAGPVRKAA
jgi:cytochrome P450